MSEAPHDKTLTWVIGYGNPGRQDDGIGPWLIKKLSSCLPQHLTHFVSLQENYQLTVEDALEACRFQRIIFVDASLNGTEPFSYTPVGTSTKGEFGSHTLDPRGLMQLCATLYQHQAEAWILGIRGYEFAEFKEQLSAPAEQNTTEALEFLLNTLEDYYA